MSLDAGGLAQMTYQPHNSFNSGLGVPTSGFASRRGTRLNMAPPSNISTINESRPTQTASPAPRTSRSHLLAGLRTAPKSPMCPSSAPPTQIQQPFHTEQNRYMTQGNANAYRQMPPQTSVGASFPNNQRYAMSPNNQMYSLPEILAPPEVQFGDEQDGEINPAEYAEVMAMKQHLAEQQMRLQQQLLQITAAQQQMQNMGLNGGMANMQQFGQRSAGHMDGGLHNQHMHQGLQPTITPVPGTPGVYAVFNPATGQQTFVMDSAAQEQQPPSPPQTTSHHLSGSPPPPSPAFRAQVSPPPEDNTPVRVFRSPSPPKPKASTPPVEVQALPPPSANAFRRGHAKNLSSVTGLSSIADGPKSALPSLGGFPQTPMTGTFGPGQARAGEHPVRQPRGPPSLEELVDKPTSKHEGSKNFVTRQRRRAVNNLVKARLERRGASRGSNSIDSLGSGTPSSECEINFSSSDNDSDSVGSVSDPGAIGSERKKMKSRADGRKSPDTPNTTASSGSEDRFSFSASMETKTELKENIRKTNPLPALGNRLGQFRGLSY